jgi:TPP-dependent pyruvate/acetoin dehydrogenase alpha subunit
VLTQSLLQEKLPILFLVIDNGRAINTFTPDVATNSDVYLQGRHYGVPGVVVNGQSLVDTLRTGRAVTDYVRANGPAIMQVCTLAVHVHVGIHKVVYIECTVIASSSNTV